MSTMSYHAFWSLRRAPFGSGELGQSFHSAKPQKEAFARLHYLVENGHGTGVLIGELGSGRTTLLNQVASSRGFGDTAVDVALTTCAHRTTAESLQNLTMQLGVCNGEAPWRAIGDRILASARQQVRTLWLIDDATAEIAQLAGSLVSENRWLTVIASTHPENLPSLAVNLGQCPLRIDLPTFSLRDTMQFVRARIKDAGGTTQIFSDSALVRMHELGDGRIGIIAHLAELALSSGATHGLSEIQAEWIEAVQDEFVRAA
ncbi:AAA family ATPase [Roseimaritima multifibrata]|nr:AAA family ATPase [Roseimaritima multifibrata]